MKKKILLVSTVSYPFDVHLKDFIRYLISFQWEVHLVCSNLPDVDGVAYHKINIERNISPLQDLISLYKLWVFIRINKFSVIHSINPKAGLLTAVAVFFSGSAGFIHSYTGQVWVTLNGIKRTVVKYSDKIIGLVCGKCLCDSFSQRDFLINEKIIDPERIMVLGEGSIGGVNLRRFSKEEINYDDTVDFMNKYQIMKDDFVMLFMGRVTRDKGVYELLEAFRVLVDRYNNIVLLVVGPLESDACSLITEIGHQSLKKVVFCGYTDTPEFFFSVADLLVLPSYREGFGSVVIQAAAMQVPAVGSDIPGLKDAIVDNKTGLLVPPRNTIALRNALEEMYINSDLRNEFAINAYNRAVGQFSDSRINELLVSVYNEF